jgi:hypothetical protein
VIRRVTAAASEAGVTTGDLLVRVAGTPYTGSRVLARALASAHPGDSLQLTIDRPVADGQADRREIIVHLVPDSSRVSARMYLLVILLGLITPVFCLLLGLSVAAIRPYDPLAWLLLLLLMSFSQVGDFGVQFHAGWPDWLRAPAIAYHAIINSSWAI